MDGGGGGGGSGARPPPAPMDSFFPWDLLHVSLQVTILSLLPVSTLIVLTSVSRSLQSTIRSPHFISSYRRRRRGRHDQDLLFLLFTDPSSGCTVAYNPSRDRLIDIHLPRGTYNYVYNGGSLLLFMRNGRIRISNPLRPSQTTILPVMLKPYNVQYCPSYNPLILIEPISTHDVDYYMVVSHNGIHSQVYDSRSGQWHMRGSFPLNFRPLCGAYVNGLLYCVSLDPDRTTFRLLTFDPAGGQWAVLDVSIPPPEAEWPFPSHYKLLAFDGGLFYVTRVRDSWEFRVWKLEGMRWRVFCAMPVELSHIFNYRAYNPFECAHRAGSICIYEHNPQCIYLMCDIVENRWWTFQRRVFFDYSVFLGTALEPHINLVLSILPSSSDMVLDRQVLYCGCYIICNQKSAHPRKKILRKMSSEQV